jgi:alkylated DNA repair dioxygenase AlkB
MATTIDGLHYHANYITEEDEIDLLQKIDAQKWDTSLKRRVQHYGRRYDYNSGSIAEELETPIFVSQIAGVLVYEEHFDDVPNQCIVNEYLPGQGISAHTDHTKQFGDTVASLSLGSACIMTFTRDDRSTDIWLERRSLVVLTGDARYLWKHSITGRKSDVHNGEKMMRDRRVSMTFRSVV